MECCLEDISLCRTKSLIFDRYHDKALLRQVVAAHSAEEGFNSMLSSLSRLPSELLIRVFESVNDFPTVLSLARTSARLQEVWKTNTASISDAILPRVIPFLAQAQKLIDSTMTHVINHLSQRKTYEEIILRIKLLFDNKALAACNLANYNQLVKHKVCVDIHSVYVRAFYQAMTLRSMTKSLSEPDSIAEFPHQYLSSLSMLEFKQLKEVMWYYKETAGAYQQFYVPLFYSQRYDQQILDHWSATFSEITYLSVHLNKVPGVWNKIYSNGHPGRHENLSWLRPESCRKNCEEASKLQLRELLALLKGINYDGSARYKIY